MCMASALPATSPSPGTTLKTPSGRPASVASSASRSAASGDCSAGLRTTLLPLASAGASFAAGISSGKFHGRDRRGYAGRLSGQRAVRAVAQRRHLAVEMVDGLGEPLDDERAVLRLPDGELPRLTHVGRLECGELLLGVDHRSREALQHRLALARRAAAPVAVLERCASGADGGIDVCLVAGGDVAEHLP